MPGRTRAGRVTRALSETFGQVTFGQVTFGQVYGTDISGEMRSRARLATADRPNVDLFQNDGQTLDVLPDVRIDSWGGLFKFQVQGAAIEEDPESTWVGVGYSEDQAGRMAEANGFEMRFSDGAGSQDYWLWFFRR